jgi:two-component system, response regulator PdtaR
MAGERSPMNRKLRVLVVDDEALVADFVADLVEEAGHVVVGVAATGEKALEYLSQVPIDLAILDIRLKGHLSGIDLAEATRTRAIPHMFITGSGDPSTRQAAEATEPLAILQKPFSQQRLVSILSSVADSKHAASGEALS